MVAITAEAAHCPARPQWYNGAAAPLLMGNLRQARLRVVSTARSRRQSRVSGRAPVGFYLKEKWRRFDIPRSSAVSATPLNSARMIVLPSMPGVTPAQATPSMTRLTKPFALGPELSWRGCYDPRRDGRQNACCAVAAITAHGCSHRFATPEALKTIMPDGVQGSSMSMRMLRPESRQRQVCASGVESSPVRRVQRRRRNRDKSCRDRRTRRATCSGLLAAATTRAYGKSGCAKQRQRGGLRNLIDDDVVEGRIVRLDSQCSWR